jgi:putative ABC transport system permease protein
MLRNYLSAALGNIGRNGLYAGITILGLAVSFAAAILIGLYVRDEYGFERFIPGYQQVYRVEFDLALPGTPPRAIDQTISSVAGNFRLDFPEAEQVARLTATGSLLKRDDVATAEQVVWADPGFFKVMPLPVLAGDPNAALEAPDGLVLTRALARKYFGEDAPIGRTLMVNSGLRFGPPALQGFHPMRVMAVLKDIPANSHLAATVFASARAPYSLISLDDRNPSPFTIDQSTYVRLKPGVSAEALRQRVAVFGQRHYPGPGGQPTAQHYRLMPLQTLHFTSGGDGRGIFRPKGDRNVDAAVAAVGALIVLIAAINFVTLMTARATRRAVEVGVRKAAGAQRLDLIVQFMGEALIYVVMAMALAVALAELALPAVNAFLRRTMVLNALADPALAAAIVGGALLTAFLAGAYPSFLLSAFGPAAALKGGANQPGGSAVVRRVLVIAQFAILIGLIVMTGTIYRQTRFALTDALRLDTSQVILMGGGCRSAFATEVAALPGVEAKSCADGVTLGRGLSNSIVTLPDRSQRTVQAANVDVGFFELQGLRPLAGRFFSRSQGQDMVLDRPNPGPDVQPAVILNESAARLLGFARPADAVGKTINWTRWSASDPNRPNQLPAARPSQIVGVVRDLTLGSIRTPIEAAIYHVEPSSTGTILAKLDGRRIPDTLAAINRLWRRAGGDGSPSLAFEDRAVQALYEDVITQGIVIAVCAGLAILIACIGLFALAAFTTERRTKEIGVRKAMGASTLNVVTLLLGQFSQPVLWANLIAWPAAWWVMNRWLQGFAYRVDLPPWLFAAATALAVAIALVTVSYQSLVVARAKPASALRYE